MHPEVRRAIVRGFYRGKKWQDRVMAMSDDQVLAIYMAKMERVREQGGTDLQLQLKAERRDEAPSERREQ